MKFEPVNSVSVAMKNPTSAILSSSHTSLQSNLTSFNNKLNNRLFISTPNKNVINSINNFSKNMRKKTAAVFHQKPKQQLVCNGNDSDIIHDLVTERFDHSFKKCLSGFCANDSSEIKLTAQSSPKTDQMENNQNSYEEYDINDFLQDALGEEFSKYKSLEESNHMNLEDASIGTSNISALLSKTGSYYSLSSKFYDKSNRSSTSVTETSKSQSFHSISSRINQLSKTCSNPFLEIGSKNTSNDSVEIKIIQLTNECVVQDEVICQIYKALDFCINTQEFYASQEHVEAETILLKTMHRKELILNEIRHLEYEDVKDTCNSLGTVRVSSLKFLPKQSTIAENHQPCFKRWFICILTCERKLYATKSVLADNNGIVKFEDEFLFEGLTSDFEIELSLYSMRIRNYNNESKYKLKQCPSPQKCIDTLMRRKKFKIAEYNYRSSAFRLWGKTKITLKNLGHGDYFEMFYMPLYSTLLNFAHLNVDSSVVITEERKGFLSIGTNTKGYTYWNRRWCVLKSTEFTFWNSPNDEDDTEKTVEVIDLRKCTATKITRVDRSLCARPRTLDLEIASEIYCDQRLVKTRYLLAADSLQEMKNWEESLNAVIFTLRNWNCILF